MQNNTQDVHDLYSFAFLLISRLVDHIENVSRSSCLLVPITTSVSELIMEIVKNEYEHGFFV